MYRKCLDINFHRKILNFPYHKIYPTIFRHFVFLYDDEIHFFKYFTTAALVTRHMKKMLTCVLDTDSFKTLGPDIIIYDLDSEHELMKKSENELHSLSPKTLHVYTICLKIMNKDLPAIERIYWVSQK